MMNPIEDRFNLMVALQKTLDSPTIDPKFLQATDKDKEGAMFLCHVMRQPRPPCGMESEKYRMALWKVNFKAWNGYGSLSKTVEKFPFVYELAELVMANISTS